MWHGKVLMTTSLPKKVANGGATKMSGGHGAIVYIQWCHVKLRGDGPGPTDGLGSPPPPIGGPS